MKIISITTLFLISLTLNAATFVKSKKIAFGTRYIDVMKTCVEGDKLRTIEPVSIYEQYLVGDDSHFEEVGKDYLYKNMTYKKEVCIISGRDKCKFVFVTKKIKREYRFDIIKNGRRSGKFDFAIKDCN